MTLGQQISARLAAVKARLAAGWADRRPHVILHIGPHRTGTSTIQATIRANRSAMPQGIGTLVHKDPPLLAATKLTMDVLSPDAAHASALLIRAMVGQIARLSAQHRVTIISEEDLLGRLPTRREFKGLYPLVEMTLPHVLAGLRDENVRVTVVWLHRDYEDWLESIFQRRFNFAPPLPYDPARFRRHYGLPIDWRGFERRLKRACAGVPVVRLSFEGDAASGIMGQGLFRLAGMSDAEIAAMKHARPKHTSPTRKTIARFAGEDGEGSKE